MLSRSKKPLESVELAVQGDNMIRDAIDDAKGKMDKKYWNVLNKHCDYFETKIETAVIIIRHINHLTRDPASRDLSFMDGMCVTLLDSWVRNDYTSAYCECGCVRFHLERADKDVLEFGISYNLATAFAEIK